MAHAMRTFVFDAGNYQCDFWEELLVRSLGR